jgi:hypothetical protein
MVIEDFLKMLWPTRIDGMVPCDVEYIKKCRMKEDSMALINIFKDWKDTLKGRKVYRFGLFSTILFA